MTLRAFGCSDTVFCITCTTHSIARSAITIWWSMPDRWKRRETLGRLAGLVTGPVYVGVYEGNGSGVGAETRDGWQANAKLEHFLPAIKADFPEAFIARISGDCRTSVQVIIFKGRFLATQSLRDMELVVPQELR